MWKIDRIIKGIKRIASYIKPVERDRWLFGHNGYGMIISAIVIAIFVPIVIWAITTFFCGSDKTTSLLLGNYDTDVTNLRGKIVGDSITITNISDTSPKHDPIWAIVSQYTDAGNIPAAQDGVGTLLALICAALGIFILSGFTVSSCINVINRKAERWKKGLKRYNDTFFKNYVVVIGVNDQTAAIIKRALRSQGVRYVLIQTRQDVEKMRMRLDLDLDRDEEEKLVFYYAERTSREDIEALHLEKAVEVYILGEDVQYGNEEDHDAFNIECLEHISKYMNIPENDQKRRMVYRLDARLTCHVDFEYQSTFTAFKATHIYQQLDKVVEFHPFNVHEIWSKKVLVDNFAVIPSGKKGEMAVQRYMPLDGEGITKDSRKTVHLIIMGMNQMGTALGVQAALLAHYPNFAKDNNLKTTITFIDDQAIKEGEFLRGRFESLFELCGYRTVDCSAEKLIYLRDKSSWDKSRGTSKYNYLQTEGKSFMDIRWEFIQGNIANEDVKQYISDIAEDAEHNITTIAICFNHPQQSLATALYLPRVVFNNALQVLTYQQNSFDILNKVATGEKDWKRYRNLYPFGMVDSSYTESIFDDSRAKIVNYLFTKRNDENAKERLRTFDESLIREIEQAWEYLSLVDKHSNMDMVESIPGKLRSMGIKYHGNLNRVNEMLKGGQDLLEAMAYSEHMRWLVERLIMGYRPLEEQERDMVLSGEKTKDYYKVSHRAHLDICSNEMLVEVDPKAPQNDRNNILNLPLILQCTEWYNFKYTKVKDSNKSGKTNLLNAFLLHKGDDGGNHLSFRYVEACKSGKHEDCHHPFWIADGPITREQWYVVTGKDKPKRNEKDLPKVDISKDDIEDFLLILRKRTGLYFTLPSKKEWRHAAMLSTGYLSRTDKWSSLICFDKEHKGKHDKDYNGAWPIRSRRKVQDNPLKVYDMMGNVWEWTRTEVENHSEAYYFCGGSWRFKKLECTLDDKEYWNTYWVPTLREDDLGCRLVWKFDVELDKAQKLEAEITSSKSRIQINRKEAVKLWLDKHMVDVEEGFFIMGTENQDTVNRCSKDYPKTAPWVCACAEDDETPHHYVRISKFKIASVPVTQELWNLVMGTSARENPSPNIGNDLPQTNISYRTIKTEFLNKLKKLTGKEYRLPTEAEWEYVAKGGQTHPISQMLSKEFAVHKNLKRADVLLNTVEGYTMYAGSNDADEVAWTKDNTNGIRPVGQKKPVSGSLSVYDMSGNIWEWCEDYYQSDMYNDCITCKDRSKIQQEVDCKEADYETLGFISNPVCRNAEYTAHVFRGGSWLFDTYDSRCTRPNYWIETDEDIDLGFRLAITE